MMLAGKVIAVTGAGRGIGQAVALACARHGAAVLVNDPGVARDGDGGDATPAAETVAAIRAEGLRAHANLASVADPAGAQSIIDDAVGHFGRIDGVVNCAGILRDRIWHKMSLEDWRAVIDVHLNGTFLVSQAATPHFRAQQSGSFVHFTSGAGLIGNVGQANYSAAKLGIVGLSQSIALDMMRLGVRSNCVAPIAHTRMLAGVTTDGVGKDDPRTAMYRAMGPEKVAALVVFLLSDAARGVTNQVFGVRQNEIAVFSKPRPLRTLGRPEGWTPETIASDLMPQLADVLPRADETAGDVYADPPV